MKSEFCCDMMDYYLTEAKKEVIVYDKSVRTYHLILHGESAGMYRQIFYCPWCGAKLPKELGEEWSEILKKEYGIDEPEWKKLEELPREFQTDEWWKKRGL
jgi:hypothetical protein